MIDLTDAEEPPRAANIHRQQNPIVGVDFPTNFSRTRSGRAFKLDEFSIRRANTNNNHLPPPIPPPPPPPYSPPPSSPDSPPPLADISATYSSPTHSSSQSYHSYSRPPYRSKTSVPTQYNPHPPDTSTHWATTNIKRARFDTFCPACRKPIRTGTRIAYQFQLRRFVHAECATKSAELPGYIPASVNEPPQASKHVPDLLAPGSPLDQLTPDYRQEAVRWVQFHADCEIIPGIHAGFSNTGLKRYLEFRSRTSKCISQILSKIKKMGQVCGFILCTSKYQQPSLQYQVLQDYKRTIHKKRRDAGLDSGRNEAIATGNFAISMLLQGFGVYDRESFFNLHPTHAELLTIHISQHVGCIRFGLFNYTTPKREDLNFSRMDLAHMLSSIWRKTHKSNRPYTIKIRCVTEDDYPGKYTVIKPDGTKIKISAGTIMNWYLQLTGLINGEGAEPLFPILAQVRDRRRFYSKWLQYVYSCVLPAGSTIPSRIRPHSARAGWATDRARQGTPTATLLAEGRWSDIRAMMLYVRECVRDQCTSDTARPIPHKDHDVPFAFN